MDKILTGKYVRKNGSIALLWWNPSDDSEWIQTIKSLC